jgi:hypothetical protein
MNSLLRLVISVGVVAAFAAGPIGAAGTLDINTAIKVDRFGDGTMTVKFKLSASEWGPWKQNFGDRPDLVRRNLRQQFACYELGEFDLDKDDVEREATATIAMRGAIKLRRDGSREIAVPKSMRKVSNTSHEWIFTSASHANPYEPVKTETTHIVLPPEAVNIQFQESNSGEHALIYEIPAPGGGSQTMLYAGVGALVIALVLGVIGFLPGKKPAPAGA